MPRPADPRVRDELVERAAELLAGTGPVSLRAVAAAAGTSTMAVYTHFGGMPGLWRAVRQQGFTHLARRLATAPRTADPVRDVMAFGTAYVANALAHPALYRAMFDDRSELDDAAAADAALGVLVQAVERARVAGRFSTDVDPAGAALQLWAMTHGLVALVIGGVLPREALDAHLPAMSAAAFAGFGDDPDAARDSAAAGWHPPGDDDAPVTER
ncbi:TetR/AcrR family transcriptional regulator [Goekera deserti]|uniref:TetR/AcrR family transcriptional regulator n=1 Tax=Goekera deserti TaxID=2497753 RepID=UPI001576A78D|nr:TetR/AcrR family transcriptional regulator [Goekera deserti]